MAEEQSCLHHRFLQMHANPAGSCAQGGRWISGVVDLDDQYPGRSCQRTYGEIEDHTKGKQLHHFQLSRIYHGRTVHSAQPGRDATTFCDERTY